VTRFSDKALEVADRVSSLASSRLKLRFQGQEISRSAATAVQQLVSGLTIAFENQKARIQTLVSSGLISDREAENRGRAASRAYVQGLEEGLATLTRSGVLKQGQAGAFLNAAGIEREFNQTAAVGQRFQQRMANVAVGVVFAFDAMTRGAAAGEGAWRRVLRAMSLLAVSVFEPPFGIIVAGIAAATDAIVESFERQSKAAEAARRHFIETAIDIARSNDIIRASTQRQLAFSGDPFARQGVGVNALTGQQVDAKETQDEFRIRRGGLQEALRLQKEITAEITRQRAAQSAAGSLGVGAGGAQVLVQLGNRLGHVNDLVKQFSEFNKEASETFETVNKRFSEIAANLLKQAQLTKLPEQLAQEGERVAAIFEDLTKSHRATEEVARAVLRAYDQLVDVMHRLRAAGKGMMDPAVEAVQKALDRFEKLGLVQMLRLGRIPAAPDVSQMATVGQGPIAGRNLSVPFGIDPSTFAHDLAMQSAEAIREALVNVLARGAIQPATGFGGGALVANDQGINRFDVIVQSIKDKFSQIGDTIGATLLASFGPVAILMRALEPAIRALTPLFDRLAVPVALVARVLVAQIEPILRALWPILRTLGIVATVVGEVFARVAAAVAQAIGGLIKAIGNVIAKIPGLGGVGHAIAQFGQSVLNFGQGAKEAADEFARTRKELQGMTWDQTAQALDDLQNSAQNASDALNNIPTGFRIQRAIFLASRPVNASDYASPAAGGASQYFAPGSVVIYTQRQDGQQLLDEVSRAARDKNMAQVGTTAGAGRVIG